VFKKNVYEKIGLLDEKFDPFYGEETDFCYRTAKAGFKIVYAPQAKIIHHGSSSTNKIEGDFVWFIKKRNGIRLELLNHKVLNILRFTLTHFFSAIFNKKPIKKISLLLKAYSENIRNFKEISLKRKNRNHYPLQVNF
jgi:GT2 family glycosyltransferase